MTAPARTPGQVLIAGVPWPLYKLVALAIGALVFVIVGLTTTAVGPAVVSAAAAATVVWLGVGLFRDRDA